jgi:hypothetical protein
MHVLTDMCGNVGDQALAALRELKDRQVAELTGGAASKEVSVTASAASAS